MILGTPINLNRAHADGQRGRKIKPVESDSSQGA